VPKSLVVYNSSCFQSQQHGGKFRVDEIRTINWNFVLSRWNVVSTLVPARLVRTIVCVCVCVCVLLWNSTLSNYLEALYSRIYPPAWWPFFRLNRTIITAIWWWKTELWLYMHNLVTATYGPQILYLDPSVRAPSTNEHFTASPTNARLIVR
jgi:hypothetical protein